MFAYFCIVYSIEKWNSRPLVIFSISPGTISIMFWKGVRRSVDRSVSPSSRQIWTIPSARFVFSVHILSICSAHIPSALFVRLTLCTVFYTSLWRAVYFMTVSVLFVRWPCPAYDRVLPMTASGLCISCSKWRIWNDISFYGCIFLYNFWAFVTLGQRWPKREKGKSF